MANASIDIKEDALPTKKLASQSLTRGVDTVHQEEVVIGDGTTDGRIAGVTAAGALKVDNSAVVQPVNDNSGSITVDALALDIRHLVTGSDKVDVRIRDAADAGFIDPPIKAQLPASVGQKTMANSLPVAIASDQTVIPVSDNSGSLTVDAPVGTPVYVRLSDGTVVLIGQKVMASSVPVTIASDQTVVPISDNSGSLTVDAPVGTPVFARLSDGAAALVGQKTMANSLPVTLASDQTAIDISDRAARETGRVRLWDGTDEATIIPLRTQPATTEKALPTFEIPNRIPVYSVTTTTITPAITVGVKELLALWSASSDTKDKYIVEIWVSWVVTTASTAGRSTIRVSTITSAPTGGTELTKADVGGAGASGMTNTMQVKTGGGTIGTTFIRKLVEHTTMPLGTYSQTIFAASNPGNGIILRGSANAGISIDLEREVAHAALVDLWTVGVRWLEI